MQWDPPSPTSRLGLVGSAVQRKNGNNETCLTSGCATLQYTLDSRRFCDLMFYKKRCNAASLPPTRRLFSFPFHEEKQTICRVLLLFLSKRRRWCWDSQHALGLPFARGSNRITEQSQSQNDAAAASPPSPLLLTC